MKTKNAVLSIALALCMLLLASCASTTPAPAAESAAPSQSTEETAAPAESAGDSEQPESTVYTEFTEIDFMNMNSSWTPVVFGDDPVTKAFMERTGVKLICSAPSGDWEQVANVMLASGDYPSLMHMDHGTIFNKYVKAGALVAMDDLVSQYGFTNITDGSTIPEEVMAVRRSEDGKLYIVPNWFSSDGFGSVGQAISVRNDVYADQGNPAIATTDELYAYLEKVRDAGYTQDGVKMWALGVGFTDTNMIGDIANMWGSQISRYMVYNESTQRVDIMLRSDTLVQALTFLNKAYHDGILDPECITFDNTQMDEAYAQGRYATTMNWFWNMWTANSALSQVDANVYYKCIDVPAGTQGVQPYFGYNHRAGSSGFMVTKNCKEQEAAARFISFFLSPEGEILDFYGIEGQTCEMRDGVPYLMDGVYEAKLADWNGYALKTGVRVFDFMMDQTYNWERRQESEDRQANRKIASDCSFNATKLMSINVDAATTEGILYAEIDAGLNAELTKMIIADDPAQIPSMVQTLLAQYEANGLVALEDEWTRQYQAMSANE